MPPNLRHESRCHEPAPLRRIPAYNPPLAGVRADARSRATPGRVAINQRTHERLRVVAQRRFGRRGNASRLGSLVLDEYLRVIERAYFGARASASVPPQHTFDAVLFDMDGVLCDSEILSREAGVATLRALHGVRAAPADFAQFTGTGEAAFLAGVAKMHGVCDFDADAAKRAFFDVYIGGGFVLDLRAFPGAPQLVRRVRKLGLKVAVASAADRVKVDANLKAIGLRGAFDFVCASDAVARKKPAPDVFLAAAAGIGVPPSRCVVLEDAVAGVLAAKAAGMRCVAVATSLPAAQLAAAGADVVRDAPAFVTVADLLDEPAGWPGEDDETEAADAEMRAGQ